MMGGMRADARANRQDLLAAAGRLLEEQGAAMSLRGVAQEAGVGVGTLYRRFPTKEALIAELVQEMLREVVILAEDALAVPDGRGLEQFVYAMGKAQMANRGCLARIWTDQDSDDLRASYRAALTLLVADAKEHRTLRHDAAVTDLDLLFWSLRSIIETTGGVSDAAWRRQVAIVLAGLGPSNDPLAEPAVADEVASHARKLSAGS